MDNERMPAKVRLTYGLGPAAEARWYCVSRDGMATLCVDELDACYTAEQSDKNWQASSPHRAVRLVDAAEIERLTDELQLCCELKRQYQEQAARSPLGHEQACRLFEDWFHADGSGVEFVRLVESAHGI